MPVFPRFRFLELTLQDYHDWMLPATRQTAEFLFGLGTEAINPDRVFTELRKLGIAGLKNPYLKFLDQATAHHYCAMKIICGSINKFAHFDRSIISTGFLAYRFWNGSE